MQSYHKVYKNGHEITPSLPFASLAELLEQHAHAFSDKEALVFLDVDSDTKQTITYHELFTTLKKLSHLLTAKYQMKKGDAIALHLGNSPFLLYFHLAAWINGFITVPLDLKRDTLERKLYKINTTQAKLIVGSGDPEERALQERLPDLSLLLEKELTSYSVELELPQTSLKEIALVLFTSGTTAHPKGVTLTAENILLNADGIADWLQITQRDRFFIVLPLHHINSTTMSMATFLKGGTIVLATRYSRTKFFKLMAENACTLSSIVPTICLDLLSEMDQFQLYKNQLSQVSRIQIGSAPVMQPDVKAFIAAYQIPLVQGYGSTETSLRVSGVKPWGIGNPLYEELVEINTIGSEQKWNNLTVLSPEDSELPEGEEGEICIRGPILTSGYLKDAESTKKAFMRGWFHSGDIGYWRMVGGEKQYFISGRAKEIIIKGGVNISPLSVEDALLKAFKEIKTCFIVGAIDPRFGEEVAAVIVFQPACREERRREILETLKSQKKKGLSNLSAYEMPGYLFITDEELLPKTSTGKVQRVVIRSFINAILHPIAQTETYTFRQLTPFDKDYLTQAITIHNTRWGKDLGIDRHTLEQAATHGILLGAIEKSSDNLKGVLFALQTTTDAIEKLSDEFKIYDSATSHLTLQTHKPSGDALLLVAITTEGEALSEEFPDETYHKLQQLAQKEITAYLPHDPVLNFHRKAKAGMEKGAEVLHVIPEGRVKDKASLGYSVIMKYPQLSETPTITSDASLGTQLLESSFMYAYDREIKHIYAYSRPAGFFQYLRALKKQG